MKGPGLVPRRRRVGEPRLPDHDLGRRLELDELAGAERPPAHSQPSVRVRGPNAAREKPRHDDAPGVSFLLVAIDALAQSEKQRTTLPGRKLGD